MSKRQLGMEQLEGRDVPSVFIGDNTAEVFAGGNNSDIIIGRGGDDILSGEGGNDRIRGDDGDDQLSGGLGNDNLRGGNGDDTLRGGEGSDALFGGRGTDTADFSDLQVSLSVDLSRSQAVAGGDRDTIYEVENILGTTLGDTLIGDRADNVIAGGAGVDTITLGRGNDAVVFDGTALGQSPDQITDFSIRNDRFVLDAADFQVTGGVKVQNALAVNLFDDGSNVIVLQDADDDNNPATAFNARSAARLIGAQRDQAGAGFFVYFNSSLNVNRLVYSTNLADGEAAITVLGALNNLTGADAIAALPKFTADNFEFRGEMLAGTAGADTLVGFGGNDVVTPGAGVDQITLGGGSDTVVFDGTALGQSPDQIADFSIAQDQFALDAAAFGITGGLRFVNTTANNLAGSNANVIVLQNSDDDDNPATAFNARSAARLIASSGVQSGPGFFVYFNSGLGVNRLVFTTDLANGEAPLTVLAALNNLTGQAAIDALSLFTEDNFKLV